MHLASEQHTYTYASICHVIAMNVRYNVGVGRSHGEVFGLHSWHHPFLPLKHLTPNMHPNPTASWEFLPREEFLALGE